VPPSLRTLPDTPVSSLLCIIADTDRQAARRLLTKHRHRNGSVITSSERARTELTNVMAKRCSAAVMGGLSVALAACSQSADNFIPTEPLMVSKFAQADRPAVQDDRSVAGKRLAVSHSFTLRLSSVEVEAVQQKHLAECRTLGCTVLNTRLDRSNEGRINARSSVRVAPDRYSEFARIIAAAPSVVITHSESVDDKTVPMIDVEKRLELKTALRGRLEAMLRDPGAKSAADLAALEKELAQVQGDIEAIIAQRDYLRTITETVSVDISYSGQAALVAGIDLSPIERAVHGIGRTLIESVAALISFLAAIVPWLPLVALLGWAVRGRLRRWKARKSQA
jgi:hypothetical protein